MKLSGKTRLDGLGQGCSSQRMEWNGRAESRGGRRQGAVSAVSAGLREQSGLLLVGWAESPVVRKSFL